MVLKTLLQIFTRMKSSRRTVSVMLSSITNNVSRPICNVTTCGYVSKKVSKDLQKLVGTSRLVKDKRNMCVGADAEIVVHDVEWQATGRHTTYVVDRRQVAVRTAAVARRQRAHCQVPSAQKQRDTLHD